jgi:hypothetical protein
MPVIWTCRADCIDYVHLIHANTTTSSGTQRRSFVVSCSIAFRQSFVEGLSCFQRSSNRVQIGAQEVLCGRISPVTR